MHRRVEVRKTEMMSEENKEGQGTEMEVDRANRLGRKKERRRRAGKDKLIVTAEATAGRTKLQQATASEMQTGVLPRVNQL